MLNLKKVIALVCAFALMLTTVAFGATYSDVAEDSAYYEAVETLNKLDIVTGYEDGTYKPEDGVTRAEMAALIARIQGYGETAKGSANTGFTDVPASHWASGYIANAAGMGIINGYGDGTFGPEDPVLYEQAVKMIMATLGYTPFAEKNGGYPTGYLAAAQRYDVSLAVSNAAVGQAANRGTVAQLLANAIDTPLMVQSKWNTNGEVEYVIADGKTYDYKTLMSENLGYVKLKGIVVENTESLVGAAKTSIDTTAKATVKIDVVDSYDTNNKAYLTHVGADGTGTGKEFLVGDTDAEDYLGYKVIAYVKNVDGKFELVSIAKDSNSNDTLTIALDQYDSYVVDSATTATCDTIKYYKDGANDTSDITVEKTFAAIVNGIGMTGTSATAYIASNGLKGGEITFVDTNDTKGYDLAIVTIATTGVVKKVTEDGINFHNNVSIADDNTPHNTMKSLEIDLDDETKVFELTKDGEAIDFTTLEEWDVISIYANAENADVIKAEVIGTEVVGTITASKKSTSSAYKVSGNGTALKVNDAWYDVAEGYYGLTGVSVGDGGKFYIDQFGKIAAFDEDSAAATGVAGTYAYVIGTSVKEAVFGGASAVDIKAQVLTADGVQVLDFKNKVDIETPGSATVTVDETTGWTVSGGTVTEAGGSTMTNAINGLKEKVVMITKNSAGEISEITKAVAGNDKFAIVTNASYASPVEGKFDADNTRFITTGSTIYADSDATVFIVNTDSSKCKMGTIADFDDEVNYDIVATYATRKATDNDIIVVKSGSFLTSSTSSIAVITEVGESVNEDSESILSLGFMIDGEEVFADTVAISDLSVTAAEGASYTNSSVTPGDIVKIKIGSDGLITAIAGVYNFTSDTVRDYSSLAASKAVGTKVAADGTSEKFAGGVVTDYNENNTLAKFGSSTQYKLSQAKNIYVIDGSGKNTVIKNGSEGNFKYFEKLYAGTANVTVTDKNNVADTDTTSDGTGAAAQAYADHVYVRTYDGKVTDVVIVKGLDIKVQ